MAPIKVFTSTLFLLVLIIFSHGIIISSEGVRLLISNVNKYSGREIDDNYASIFEKFPAASEKAGVLGVVDGARRALGGSATAATADDDEAEAAAGSAIKSTDEYRPTAPGHSPGAGHSHGPSSVIQTSN